MSDDLENAELLAREINIKPWNTKAQALLGIYRHREEAS